jgi:hypothetical protein
MTGAAAPRGLLSLPQAVTVAAQIDSASAAALSALPFPSSLTNLAF